jgi:hypothetical protein
LKDLHFSELLERRTLIIGDVGSGKTTLTARLLEEAIMNFRVAKITVIDMAPRSVQFKGISIGGLISDSLKKYSHLRLFTPNLKLHAPRIEGRTADDVLQMARTNAAIIDELLQRYMSDPTPILFVNDASIYLQAGNMNALLKAVLLAQTFVGNSYSGLTLEDDNQSGLSQRERIGLTALKKIMDKVLTVSPACIIEQDRRVK